MSNTTYTPGVGFPARLRALLTKKNVRLQALETEKLVSKDTLARWMSGQTYPDKQLYFNVCRRLGLSSAEGWNLLRESREAALVCVGNGERRVGALLAHCDRLEVTLPTLDADQLTRLAERARALAQAAEEQKSCLRDSTTTETATAS